MTPDPIGETLPAGMLAGGERIWHPSGLATDGETYEITVVAVTAPDADGMLVVTPDRSAPFPLASDWPVRFYTEDDARFERDLYVDAAAQIIDRHTWGRPV